MLRFIKKLLIAAMAFVGCSALFSGNLLILMCFNEQSRM